MSIFNFFKSKNKLQDSKPVHNYSDNVLVSSPPVKTEHEIFLEKLSNWKPPSLYPPKEIGEFLLNKKYIYRDVELKVVPNDIHFEFNMVGKEVNLIPEPDNEFDSGAIIVALGDLKLGYIPKNNLQSMIHDFTKKKLPVYSVVSNMEIDQDTEMITGVSVFLGFYHNPLDGIEKYNSTKTKLTKTSKKDFFENSRQENILYASEGDIVNLEYDYDTSSYLVMLDSQELGETTASVTKKLQDFDSDCDFIGKIDEISENDSGKYVVAITIYFKSM